MKAWFAKMRISAALDGARRLATCRRSKASVADELRRFERELAALDNALRQTAPRPQAPPSLHCSIMQAIQAAERPPAKAEREFAFLRWLPAPVVAVLALMAVWYVAQAPVKKPVEGTPPLGSATAALEVGGKMARTMPGAVFTPLTDELENLHRDLENTAQFLLASLP
jgi:hypothetical protein